VRVRVREGGVGREREGGFGGQGGARERGGERGVDVDCGGGLWGFGRLRCRTGEAEGAGERVGWGEDTAGVDEADRGGMERRGQA
jgi:hypothetical protein